MSGMRPWKFRINYVCFDCRVSVRRLTDPHAYLDHRYQRTGRLAEEVRCPECGGPCRELGVYIPVPPKRDVKAWRELEKKLREGRIEEDAEVRRRIVRRRHAIERRIEQIRHEWSPSPDKERTIEFLEDVAKLQDGKAPLGTLRLSYGGGSELEM